MDQEKDLALSLPLQVSNLAQGLVLASTSILAFFVPFVIGHPQWLVGTVVNACLFLGVLYLPKRYYIPLAILPSLGVLSRGLLFGPLTTFLVYFLPFIWLGNIILILVFKKSVIPGLTRNPEVRALTLDSRFRGNDIVRFGLSVFAGATVKFLFLFLMANIYFNLHIVPKLFLTAMGLNQLATALAGGIVAFLMFKLLGKNTNDSRSRRTN